MKKYIKWIFVLLWMILVFVLSSESGRESIQTSHFYVDKILHLFPFISIEWVTFLVRKFAHFFLYFVLGILVSNASNGKNKRWMKFSFLICFLYACTDEFHQLFVIGRSGELKDVFWDGFGSGVGIYLYHWFCKKKMVY